MPRYLTLMLLVPLGGAAEKVRVVPDTEYVLGSCSTPVMATMMDDVFAGATVIVKATCEPVPLNVSVRKAAEIGAFPIYDITPPLL
jgi:hypothetical protein